MNRILAFSQLCATSARLDGSPHLRGRDTVQRTMARRVLQWHKPGHRPRAVVDPGSRRRPLLRLNGSLRNRGCVRERGQRRRRGARRQRGASCLGRQVGHIRCRRRSAWSRCRESPFDRQGRVRCLCCLLLRGSILGIFLPVRGLRVLVAHPNETWTGLIVSTCAAVG